MDRSTFFDALWSRYRHLTPQADAIQAGLQARGESVRNDHVALRSLAETPFDLDGIEVLLTTIGYQRLDQYVFPDKHLDARSYRCFDDPEAPKIFVSTLRRGVLSSTAEAVLDSCAKGLTKAPVELETLTSGICWQPISHASFQMLASESEYAAWLSAWGLQANHFTVSVNHLQTFQGLAEVNAWIRTCGFSLNQSGGEIKGSAEVLLAQSATVADQLAYRFGCGETHQIPSCFYEFAERFPDASGGLFQGFVTANANHIFDSTNQLQ
jgi:hypothetical protein